MVGIESQLNNLAGYIKNSHGIKHCTSTQPRQSTAEGSTFADNMLVGSNKLDQARSFPSLHFQVLRSRSCENVCPCICHQTHRLRSPGCAEKMIGHLFVGYAGFPTLFQKCDVLGCNQASPKVAKIAYKFPWWFWQRAINIGFSWSCPDGPELLLRFPCIRPSSCEWFGLARLGDAEGMRNLLERKQASGKLHQICRI